jgi:iron complex outermembrane receptor protein
MDGENLVLEVPTDMPGPPQRRNTGSFTNKGLELQTKFKARENLNFLLNYSFLNASEAVLYAPQHNLGLQARYAIKKLSIHAGLQHISGLNTSLLTEEDQENYTLLNARINLEATPWLQLFIQGDNLLDVEYQIENGYPMPGINILGGINVHF